MYRGNWYNTLSAYLIEQISTYHTNIYISNDNEISYQRFNRISICYKKVKECMYIKILYMWRWYECSWQHNRVFF